MLIVSGMKKKNMSELKLTRLIILYHQVVKWDRYQNKKSEMASCLLKFSIPFDELIQIKGMFFVFKRQFYEFLLLERWEDVTGPDMLQPTYHENDNEFNIIPTETWSLMQKSREKRLNHQQSNEKGYIVHKQISVRITAVLQTLYWIIELEKRKAWIITKHRRSLEVE